MDGTGYGHRVAHPCPVCEGHAWPQCAVSMEISIRRGTVAMPALTSAPWAAHCAHDSLPVWPRDGGTRPSAGAQNTASTLRRRTRGSRPPGVGRPLPRAPHAINQTRRGMATVIAHQTAALLPCPRDQASVIRSTATIRGLPAGPASWRALVVGGEDGGLRDRRLGPAPSRITIVSLGGRSI